MEEEYVVFYKEERTCIFKLPPTSTSKGYYLDDWKEMVFDGSLLIIRCSQSFRKEITASYQIHAKRWNHLCLVISTIKSTISLCQNHRFTKGICIKNE